MTEPHSCCANKTTPPDPCCGENTHTHGGYDWLMIGAGLLVAVPLLFMFIAPEFVNAHAWAMTYTHAIHEFVVMAWWGVVIGILCLAAIAHVPREFIMSVLGNKKGANGIIRAILAGVLLDLCNHGILMIGAKLYQRGASAGQVMAFLIASPWNSLSLTFILIAMIGLKLTLLFIVLSGVIAFVTGLVFDYLVKNKTLPENPNAFDLPENFDFWPQAKNQFKSVLWTPSYILHLLIHGLKDSKMVLRWLLVGIVIAATLRVFIDPATFAQWFGPTLLGMAATVLFATILEVCSEGSAPIASDLVNRAGASGNGFAFLMAGASTDYTEIMVLKDTTKSWKIALFLPLITLPQIIFLGLMLNF